MIARDRALRSNVPTLISEDLNPESPNYRLEGQSSKKDIEQEHIDSKARRLPQTSLGAAAPRQNDAYLRAVNHLDGQHSYHA